MKYVEASPSDAFEAIILFDALEPDTLAFIELPRCVYVGVGCNLFRNVNLQYCVDNGIPVVRGVAAGRTVSYRGDDNLWLVFNPNPMSLDTLKKFLVDTFSNLGIDASIKFNDVMVGDSRIAMFWFNNSMLVIEICLSADFKEINKTLRFPPEKWVNKPVSKIEDWLLPLNSLLDFPFKLPAKEMVKSELIVQVEKHLDVGLTKRDLSASELAKVSALSEKYRSETWLKYGKWSPVKDYWREA